MRDTFECVCAFRSLYTEQENLCDPALAPLERGAVVKRSRARRLLLVQQCAESSNL